MNETPKLEKNKVPKEKNRAFQFGEVGKIRWEVLEYLNGEGFDLGCGSFRVHRNAIGIDNNPGPWNGAPSQLSLRADIESLEKWRDKSMDYVFSSHALEHLADWQKALAEWWRVLKPGGHLVLYLPHRELFEPYEDDAKRQGEHHETELDPDMVFEAMMHVRSGWDLVRSEIRNQTDEYSFLMVFRKRKDKQQNQVQAKPKPPKTVGVVRYGGIGDHIITSTIYPVLVGLGYHVTLITNPAGKEIMKACPFINEFIVDSAGISGEEILSYWNTLSARFDHFINAMDSVENVALPQRGTPQYLWSEGARRVLLNRNYNEATHLICQVDMPSHVDQRYYSSDEGEDWARKERDRREGQFLILWALRGSSPHKVSPAVPQAINLVLDRYPNAHIITTGGEKDAGLYQDFPPEDETPRHTRLAGKLTVDEAFSLARYADLVVGPETGLVNSVGTAEEVGKCVWLSHSSEENLTKYWKNVVPVHPNRFLAPCSPCHRLHWNLEFCHQHETGAPLCVAAIPPEKMAWAVGLWLDAAGEARRPDKGEEVGEAA